MATDDQWGRRLRSAKRAWEERHDARLTFKAMGRQLAEMTGREKPFRHTAVRGWFEEGQEPESFAIVRALATLLEVDVGSLLTELPATQNGNVKHEGATPQQIRAAEKKFERELAEIERRRLGEAASVPKHRKPSRRSKGA